MFASDRTEWWNLYRWRDGAVTQVVDRAAEYAHPQWVFGMSAYAFVNDTSLVAASNTGGIWGLSRIDIETGEETPITSPNTDFDDIHGGNGRLLFVGSSPTQSSAIVCLDVASGTFEELVHGSTLTIDPGYISTPEAIEYPTENGLTAYGFYYPPTNRDSSGLAGELPPLIVLSHGGPTSSTSTSLTLWTSILDQPGIAVLDVNYGGSTGYGRAYRQRLNRSWGIVDVDDCVNGAQYLAQRGSVDRDRIAMADERQRLHHARCPYVPRFFQSRGQSFRGQRAGALAH